MTRVLLAFITLSFSACGGGTNQSVTNPEPGTRYLVAREAFIEDGWTPRPAKCSERVICFEYPELATYLDSGKSCAQFVKKNKIIEVCVTSIADDALVAFTNEI